MAAAGAISLREEDRDAELLGSAEATVRRNSRGRGHVAAADMETADPRNSSSKRSGGRKTALAQLAVAPCRRRAQERTSPSAIEPRRLFSKGEAARYCPSPRRGWRRRCAGKRRPMKFRHPGLNAQASFQS